MGRDRLDYQPLFGKGAHRESGGNRAYSRDRGFSSLLSLSMYIYIKVSCSQGTQAVLPLFYNNGVSFALEKLRINLLKNQGK